MDTARKASEDSSDGMNHFPERKVDSSAQGHDIAELSHFIVGPEHGQVETSKDGNTIDGKVGR